MAVGGICNSGVSWFRGFVTCLPGIGLVMDLVANRPYLFFNCADPVQETSAPFVNYTGVLRREQSHFTQTAVPGALIGSLGNATQHLESQRRSLDLRSQNKDSDVLFFAALYKERVYMRATWVCHVLTVSILFILVVAYEVPTYYLTIGIPNLVWWYFDFKALSRNTRIVSDLEKQQV